MHRVCIMNTTSRIPKYQPIQIQLEQQTAKGLRTTTFLSFKVRGMHEDDSSTCNSTCNTISRQFAVRSVK